MASEIQYAHSASSETLYAIVRSRDALVLQPSIPGFVAYNGAFRNDYAIPLAEQGSSQHYVGSIPAIDAGWYHVAVYHQAGGSVAESDPPLFQGVFSWSGAVLMSLADIVAKLPSALVSGNIAASVQDLPTALQNALSDNLLDRAHAIETDFTLRQTLRLLLAALAGKLSGAGGTSIAVRDVNDSKNRIQATVDALGNRTALTLDAS